MAARVLVLVKHALPVLDPATPARDWPLGIEGEKQASLMAEALRAFAPFRLVTSVEPKARRTGEIIAAAVGVEVHTAEGLHEIDRRVLPIWSKEEHQRANAEIFTAMDRAVLGTESGRDALRRFDAAIKSELALAADTLVAVTHGTVIALFAASYNSALDAFELWSGLECGAFVVLSVPAFTLVGRG